MRFILAFLVCFSTQAATYYISTNGLDSNPGTVGSPWLTLQKGATTAASGDTVLVQPGVYDEYVQFNNSSTLTNGIVFAGNGPGVSNMGMFFIKGSGVTLSNIDCVGSSANDFIAPCWIGNFPISNVWVTGCRFHDGKDTYPFACVDFDSTVVSGIITNYTSNCVITNNQLWDYQGIGIVLRGRNSIAVNNWLSNSFGADAFGIASAINMTVRGNICQQIGSGIIGLYGAGNATFNGPYLWNYAQGQAWNGLGVWTNAAGYALVDDENYNSDHLGWSNHFNIVNISRTKTYAYALTLTGTWTVNDAAIVSGFTSARGLIEHPDFIQTFGASAGSYTWASNVLVEGNICINSPGGAIGQLECNNDTNIARVTDWTFRNNVFADLDLSCSVDIPNCHWYNNTFFRCNPNGGCMSFGWFSPTNGDGTVDGNTDARGQAYGGRVYNNAFIGCGWNASAGWYSGAQQTYTNVGLTTWHPIPPIDLYSNVDYNFVCKSNFTAWPSTNAYPTTNNFLWSEPHGINGGNPLLVALYNGQYRQIRLSPLIDAGTNIAGAPTIDINGATRPMGSAYDIGAYEYDPNLLLWYDFEQDFSGGQVLDTTGHTNTGWQCSTNWPVATTGVNGGTGGYWVTNVTITEPPSTVIPISQWISVTNIGGSSLEYLTNGTMSFWLKPSTNNNTSGTFVLDTGSSLQAVSPASAVSNSWSIYGDGHSYYNLLVYDASAYSREVVSWPNAQTDRYHLYTVTWNNTAGANQAIAYYDGVPTSTNNSLNIPWFRMYGCAAFRWMSIGRMTHNMSPSPLSEAGNYVAGFYQGSMDDIRFYNRALTNSEVLALYSVNAVPSGSSGGGTNPPPAVTLSPSVSLSGNVKITGHATLK